MNRSLFELGFVLEAVDHASHVVHKVDESVHHLRGTVESAATGLRSTGKNLMLAGGAIAGAGLGVAAGLYAMAEPAIESTHALKLAEIQLGLTGRATEQLEKASLSYSRSFPGSEEEYKQTATLLGRVTHEQDDLAQTISATNVAMKVASVTQTGMAESASAMIKMYATLGDATRPIGPQMKEIGDLIAKTQESFGMPDMNRFALGLSKLGPLSKSLGISKEQTLTFLGIAQRDLGPRGAMQLSQSFGHLLTHGKERALLGVTLVPGKTDYASILEQIRHHVEGMSPLGRTQLLEKALGPGAAPAVMQMIKDLDELIKKTADAGHAKGLLDEKMRRMIDEDPKLGLKVLKNNLEDLAIVIGTPLVPMISRAIKGITELVIKAAGFASAHPGLIQAALEVAAIGSAALIAGGGVTALAGAIAFIAGSAIGAPVAGLTLLAGAAVGVWQAFEHWDAIKPMLEDLWPTLEKAAPAALLVDAAARVWRSARSTFSAPIYRPMLPAQYQTAILHVTPKIIPVHIPPVTVPVQLSTTALADQAAAAGRASGATWADWFATEVSVDVRATGAMLQDLGLWFVDTMFSIDWAGKALAIVDALAAGLAGAAGFLKGATDELSDRIGQPLKDLAKWVEEEGGVNIVKALGRGMLSGLFDIVEVADTIGATIAGYLVGHSPPPRGPLHQLGRTNLLDPLADSLSTTRLTAALDRSLAAVRAATTLPTPLLALPATGFPVTDESPGPRTDHLSGHSSSSTTVHLNYSPRITIGGAEGQNLTQLRSLLAGHADDLVERLETARRRAAWAEY